jgi:hypothetical protein
LTSERHARQLWRSECVYNQVLFPHQYLLFSSAALSFIKSAFQFKLNHLPSNITFFLSCARYNLSISHLQGNFPFLLPTNFFCLYFNTSISNQQTVEMQFSFATISLALLTLSIASPVPTTSKEKAAAKAAKAAASSTTVAASAATSAAASNSSAAASGGLTASDYNTIQISSGTAGTAETQANALFASIDQNNLAGVSAADLAVVQGTHDAAEDAETTGFNPAIAAATGDAATALQVRNPKRREF